MIIVIGSEKGGVGKSTMATNIAVYLFLKGKEVILVDADRQGTSSVWSQDRHISGIASVSKFGNVKETLESLRSKYEYTIVDCQGRDSEELRSSLLVADICITPVRPSQADIDTIHKMVYTINAARMVNPGLKEFCLITQAPNTKEVKEAQLELQVNGKLNLLNSIIYDRRVYRDALGEGKSVLEMKDTKAIQELNAVCEEIFQWQ